MFPKDESQAKICLTLKQTPVLLVDDEVDYIDTLAERLEMRGFLPKTVYDGAEAVQEMQEAVYPIMILDLRMPGMDGIEVLRHVARLSPATRVIVVTGHGQKRDREECERLGAAAYMNKPVEFSRLVAEVKRVLEQV